MKGYLVLDSEEVFEGIWETSSSNPGSRIGEVVFNTSHSGYQEVASDPSYFSQIMVMTAPMQGNYGFFDDEFESRKIWIEGLVCVEMQKKNLSGKWREYLLSKGVPILSGIDTRALTLRLRDGGTPWGALLQASSKSAALEKAKELLKTKKLFGQDWTKLVTVDKVTEISGQSQAGRRFALLDFGIKENIVRQILVNSSQVAVFPSGSTAKEVQDWNPDGIVLSNGPGDPTDVKDGIETVRNLLGWRPMFGICMGHQVLALALGARTFKMKFGHRGSNHPVRDDVLEKIYVTSQNHGYAVDDKSLPSGARVSHVNLNDGTVEGFEFAAKNCLSVQFHPESAPGPSDARMLFKHFVDRVK